MAISIDSDAATKNLELWVEGTDDPDTIVAEINTGVGKGTKLRYKKESEQGTYAVSVALKEHHNNGDYVQENYYLSIFTKEDKLDQNIYHYSFTSSGTTLGDSYFPSGNTANYPTARVGNQTPHIFLGNIYSYVAT